MIGSKQCFKLRFPGKKIYNKKLKFPRKKIYDKNKSKSKLVVKYMVFRSALYF